jgi:molybdopterin synthase catalytic subunit
MTVRVQEADFDLNAELTALRADDARVGALASFIGLVRDVNDGAGVSEMTLEHYPGMTEKALEAIVAEAKARWDIFGALVIHRVGPLRPCDQIVLVAVTSAHRGEAFAACEFIMDYLKTRAPFWKRETTPDGARWVDARDHDNSAAERWRADSSRRPPRRSA